MEVKRDVRRRLLIIIYTVLIFAASGLLFQWDTETGIILFFAMLIPLVGLMRWPNSPKLLFIGFVVMVIGKLVYVQTLNPLRGPDEKHYYEQVVAFADLGSFFNFAWEHIVTNWSNASAYPVYGMLYMPFFKGMQIDHPLTIVVFNTLIFLVVVQQTYQLCRDHFNYPLPELTDNKFRSWIIFGLLISPSFMFMSSLFAKDVTCALLGMYGALLLIRKKYIWFIIVLLYATGLRDYAFVYTVGIYLLYKGHLKTAFTFTVGAAGIVFLFTGFSGVINAGLLTLFLFLSPNPFNPANWDPVMMYRTAEALFMSLSIAGAVMVYINAPETRKFYKIVLFVLFTYACTLILVGYVTIVTRELDYGVGTIGDNMVRKKLPILPLLYVFSAYTMVWLGKLTRPKRVHKEVLSCEEGISSGELKPYSASLRSP
ncbi:hypothetical protein [Cohnella abietis]|uniref:Glycosyltransferase RgtA/B/C/D-like domain-containing protein n=1 Tax=Cohnella abietis TaxID=2507935 RepID=A0A3T1D1W2_9BACL|nr:hypothetical protein [Cohnella abietis]BBI32093.1 hypothetical protein KCTCHS21_14920 [Cohnella abietis]